MSIAGENMVLDQLALLHVEMAVDSSIDSTPYGRTFGVTSPPMTFLIPRLFVAVAATLLTAVGCAIPAPEPADATTEIRHDLSPLTKRFPLLDTPVSASWITWNNEGGRTPGPTTHWIQAVVELRPEAADGLRSRFTLSAVQPSQFEATLQPSVPPGGYVSNPEFDAAFSTNGWKVGAFLQVEGTAILIDAVD
ncbi:hypothetical protein ACFWU5_10635 [Nocardia sp. NPDC058640]|uniref:hypothetical protein n=1 Tax=Nocardia sp. NPDC058640 TaxID=3346571 RepID=UPI003666D5B8